MELPGIPSAILLKHCADVINLLAMVTWLKTTPGVLKLNTNGGSKGNPGQSGGGGGILRDSDGNMILAFSSHFGSSTSAQAEIRRYYLELDYARGMVLICSKFNWIQWFLFKF